MIAHWMEIVSVSPDRKYVEYFCPECGRRTKVHYPPNYRRVVLTAGDETALHMMPCGEVVMRSGEIVQRAPADDPYLKPFEDYLRGKI